MILRWLSLIVFAACTSSAPPAATTAPQAATAGYLSADGTRFTAERIYEGDCMPAGTRGGCHTITFRPDGSYRNFLFDAAMEGTYTIAGSVVTLTASDPAMNQNLTLSPDGTKLDTLTLKPGA
jgi:hypothetical protein